MIIEEIQRRLTDEMDIDVKGAADLAAAQEDLQRDTLYVVLVREEAGENTLENAVRQRRTLHVGIVLGLTNVRDKRGEAARREIDLRNEAIIRALLGWEPPAAESPMYYQGGRLLSITRSVNWWQSDFETTDYLTA